MQKPQHALRPGEIGDDVVHGLALRLRQRIGQRLENCCGLDAFACGAAAALLAHMAAHQRQRELAGEHFVIGEARIGAAFRQHVGGLVGAMQGAQRVAERRQLLARDPGLVLPLRQVRQLLDGLIDRAAHIAERESFGERIDRLDQRQLGEARLVDDAVGMHHLQIAVIELGGARDVAQLAFRQELFEVIAPRTEEHEGQIGEGVVVGIDPVRRARPVRRRRTMVAHRHGDGHERAGHHVAQFGPRPAIDRAGRHVEQQIDQLGRIAVEQMRVKLAELRPDRRTKSRARRIAD